MKLQGKISLRGPFRKEDDEKLLQFIANHPFNMEIMSCLPTLREFNKKNKMVEEVKRLDFEEKENDDDAFVSFTSTKTDVFDDSILSNTNGFFYKVTGHAELLLDDPFFSSYIAPSQRLVIQTVNTPVNTCNSLSIIGGRYIIVKLDTYSYQRLGIAAKHADFRLLRDRCYLSIIPLQKLQTTSHLLTRIRECFEATPSLELVVFSYNQEIDFPSGFHVEKIQITTIKNKATTSPILLLDQSAFESLLSSSEEIDQKSGNEIEEEEVRQNQKIEKQSNRQENLCGFLDWIGCVEASSMGMTLCFTNAVNPFSLPSCFQYISGNEFNFVNIYRNSGFFSVNDIGSKLSFLQDHVNKGNSPFALLAVYGSSCSADIVQWIIDKTTSEYNFLQDDDAHYVIVIFPNNIRYVILLSADMESRL